MVKGSVGYEDGRGNMKFDEKHDFRGLLDYSLCLRSPLNPHAALPATTTLACIPRFSKPLPVPTRATSWPTATIRIPGRRSRSSRSTSDRTLQFFSPSTGLEQMF